MLAYLLVSKIGIISKSNIYISRTLFKRYLGIDYLNQTMRTFNEIIFFLSPKLFS